MVGVDDDGDNGRTAAGDDDGWASDEERARTVKRVRDS